MIETNYIEEEVPGGVPVKMWTRGVPIEDEAKRQLTNAFATDRPRLQTVFKDWMLSLDTKAAFTTKLLLPHFLDRVEQTPSNTCAPFPVMVDAVFDHLTY